MATTLTVSQVNTYIKSLLDEIPPLRNVYVAGEISNFKHYPQSGHMYFTLKDAKSQLKCVMFAFDNSSLKFEPQNGMGVVCFGQIGVYERDGVYQLYVKGMQPKGVGSLQVAFEQLKEKLNSEGLFDDFHKKPIPKYPSKIGVATSNMGAAVEDIKNVISRRYPLADIYIVPTIVQGESAINDIVSSLQILDNMGLDIIIVGRGGGSIEDLWAFNTEPVARAVFACKTPVISAVGHETDYTICDFVSDLRAPTPSAAAELAVPDVQNEIIQLSNICGTLDMLINSRIELEENRLSSITKASVLSSINEVFNQQYEKLDALNKAMLKNMSYVLDNKNNELSKNAAMLNALSPLAVLGRGYSITKSGDKLISSVDKIKPNSSVSVMLHDGSFSATVNEVIKND